MKKIVLIGDSLTDMWRFHDVDLKVHSYGCGYPFFVEGELATRSPKKYAIYNRGVSGNKSVDIYARLKSDCLSMEPDIVSCFFGINDLAFNIKHNTGVSLDRYKTVYRMIIDDTLERLPNAKFILVEPIMLKGTETQDYYDEFLKIRDYSDAVKEIAAEYGFPFVELQKKFDRLANENGAEHWLYDGVHPTVAGAKAIADEWVRVFCESIDKDF